MRKVLGLILQYDEPTGKIVLKENLLSSKFLLSQLICDFTYKNWYKKEGKTFYVCNLNDPIVAVLQHPVWMHSIHLYLPEEEDKEFCFHVEVSKSPLITFKGKDGWEMIDKFEGIRGHFDVIFDECIVNAFRITGTKIINGKGKEFAVQIKL